MPLQHHGERPVRITGLPIPTWLDGLIPDGSRNVERASPIAIDSRTIGTHDPGARTVRKEAWNEETGVTFDECIVRTQSSD